MAIKVGGVKIGDLEVHIEGGEGATLKDVLKAVGIAQEGQQFIINGDRKAPVTDAIRTRVHDGDTVEVFERPQAGGGLSALGLRLKHIPWMTTVKFSNGVVLSVRPARS